MDEDSLVRPTVSGDGEVILISFLDSGLLDCNTDVVTQKINIDIFTAMRTSDIPFACNLKEHTVNIFSLTTCKCILFFYLVLVYLTTVSFANTIASIQANVNEF